MNEKRDAYRDKLKAWVIENQPKWLDEKPAADWVSELKSKSTKKKARSVFPLFMGFIEMGPQEMYDKRVDDLQARDPKTRNFFETNLKKFAKALFKVGYSPKSIRAAYVVQIQSFFAHNYMPLKFPKGAFDFDVTEAMTKSPPTNEEVREMFKIADMEDRLLLHFLYQNGMAPVDVSNLQIAKMPISRDVEVGFIFWEYVRDKTNVKARTALNPELVNTYKVLMTRRGWPEDGWVFETARGGRLMQRYIRERIGALASKVGVECKPKDFRDSFNEVLLESEMKQEVKDSLMGHKRAGARGAYSISRRAITNAYKMAHAGLSLNGGGFGKSQKNLEEILSAVTVAMLANNPTKEFITLIENAYGFEAGSIKDMLGERMTMDQMKTRLMEKLAQAQDTSQNT